MQTGAVLGGTVAFLLGMLTERAYQTITDWLDGRAKVRKARSVMFLEVPKTFGLLLVALAVLGVWIWSTLK